MKYAKLVVELMFWVKDLYANNHDS